ncbi:MAG: hypothetical protein ABF785_04375 [Acetobacter papayae]|uniref:hypothetical protein n=1 Tax=Acetobacter papayae TaxID=1076592 RepID=UPI0039ED6E62
MTDQKPTGVFVRLPLSDEDCMTIRKHITSKFLKNDGIVNGILAIGTTVQGGELEVVGWSHPQQLVDLHIDNGSPDDERFIVMSRVQIGSRDIALVRQSDALSQIAVRDAEIARLQSAMTEIAAISDDVKYRETYSALMHCVTVTKKALKGGAA